MKACRAHSSFREEHGFTLGRGSDRASQDSRLRSQKGGVEFINFPFGPFGSEICSEQLLESGVRSKRANTDRAVDQQNSRIAKSHF